MEVFVLPKIQRSGWSVDRSWMEVGDEVLHLLSELGLRLRVCTVEHREPQFVRVVG